MKGQVYNYFSYGQNIMELVIGVALIAIVAIVALSALGGNIQTMFSKSNEAAKTYKPFDWATVNNNQSSTTTTNPYVNTGTPAPDNPIATCNNGKCDIDFGDFIITGLSDNFSEIVENNGIPGSTDYLMNYLDEIISQLEKEYGSADLKAIKALANIGHSLAQDQRMLQTNAGEFTVVTNYQEVTSSLNNTSAAYNGVLSTKLTFAEQLEAINQLYGGTSSPLPPEVSNGILSVVNAMSQEIGTLNDEMLLYSDELINVSQSMANASSSETQELTESDMTFFTNLLNSLQNPEYANKTDLDSEIICKTGKGEDFDKQCH
jgi:hypothetical protein